MADLGCLIPSYKVKDLFVTEFSTMDEVARIEKEHLVELGQLFLEIDERRLMYNLSVDT